MPIPSAIVLCGGEGIRLRPLTADIPKPLVPVRGKPIVDFIVEFLRKQSVADITIAGGYLVDKLEQHFKGIEYVNVVDTGNGDIITRLKQLLGANADETLVLYGDTLSDVNLLALLDAHRLSGCEATVTVWPLKSSFGVFDLDIQSKVVKYQEKPELDKWINIGYFVLSQIAVERLNAFATFEEFLNDLTLRGQLHAFQHRGIHVTVNSRAELDEAENFLQSDLD